MVVEAHDFPYPKREKKIDFEGIATGSTPSGWSVVQGLPGALTVEAAAGEKFLRGVAGQDPVIAVYSPPWEAPEFSFATEVRLPSGNRQGVGLVFGYIDERNYGRVVLDGAVGAIEVSRQIDGVESVLVRRPVPLVSGQWITLEIGYEDGTLEINFQDDAVEFAVQVGTPLPVAPLGFWIPRGSQADFREFSVESDPKSPRVSIVSTAAYANGDATMDVLRAAAGPFRAGAGLAMAERTPVWAAGAGVQGEFEWALVVRRFADGGVTNEDGDRFEFRMVDQRGNAAQAGPTPRLRLAIPPGHVGGTFVEAPGRIGPWQAKNGDLYFIMEPAESSNLFMMVKSSDGGRSWREVDAANRPKTDDLEAVDGRQVGDTIHILHQVTQRSVHHAFRTSDHPAQPDTWVVRDELAATADSFAQAATLVVRNDGSMVAFHVGQATIHVAVRSREGVWADAGVIDTQVAGPSAVLGANNVIHLAYYGLDGALWYRRMAPDGTLSGRESLATGAGVSRAEYGAVMPLVFIPETNTLAILYRLADGHLWERRTTDGGPLSPAVRVSDRPVVTDAVDSQQPGADVVREGETLHVLFIDEATRSLYHTHNRGGWQPAVLRVDGIEAGWVRGNVYTRPDGVRVYGYIYDAGSEGGAGMNRFGEIELNGR